MYLRKSQNNKSLKSPEIWTFFALFSVFLISYCIQLYTDTYKDYLVLSLKDYFFQIQIITYALVHKNILHLISNLIIFALLYRFMIQYFANKFTWFIFILSILFGGLGFLWLPNSNDSAYIMGISSGNLGWFLSMWYYHPNSQLKLAQFTIQFKLLIIIILIIHLTSLIVDKSNSWQAHVGSVFILPLFLINSLINKNK